MEKTPALVLRDIHLPDAISWWPPAPGWWILLGLVLATFCTVWLVRRIQQSRSVRVAALKALQAISADFAQDRDAHKLVKALSVLLRRVCLSYFPRSDVAGLTGEKWLEFLDQCLDWGNVPDRFSRGTGRVLITAPYQTHPSLEAEPLLDLCRHWIMALPLLRKAP